MSALLKQTAAKLTLAAVTLGAIPAGAAAPQFRHRHAKAPVAAPADPAVTVADPLTLRGPLTPEAEAAAFRQTIQLAPHADEAKTVVNAAQLIGLGLGGWPLARHAYDPNLILNVPLNLSTVVVPPEAAPLVGQGGVQGVPVYPPDYRNPFDARYRKVEGAVFSQIEGIEYIASPDGPQDLRAGTAMAGTLGFNATGIERDKLDDLLTPLAAKTAAETKEIGFGPLEALLASRETPDQTAARHAALDDLIAGNRTPEAAAVSPLLYHNLRTFVYEVERAGLYSRRWEKGAPTDAAGIEDAIHTALGSPALEKGSALFADKAAASDAATYPAVPLDFGNGTAQALKDSGLAADPRFYTEIVPALYRDVLEIEGDPQASQEMGLAPDNAYAKSALEHLIHRSEGPPATLGAEDWNKLAAHVEPGTVPFLLREALAHHDATAFGALLKTPQGAALSPGEKAQLLAQALIDTSAATDANELEGRRIVGLLFQSGADLDNLPPAPEEPAPDVDTSRLPTMNRAALQAPFGRVAPAAAPTLGEGRVIL